MDDDTPDEYEHVCQCCGRVFLDSVSPARMVDPLCHDCYTGGRPGQMYRDGGFYNGSDWRQRRDG